MFHVHRFTFIYKFTLKHCILFGSFYWQLIVWFTTFILSIYTYIEFVLFRIVHAAVTYLDGVSFLNILLSLWSLGKHLLTKDRTRWPMFELTFVLNGELH